MKLNNQIWGGFIMMINTLRNILLRALNAIPKESLESRFEDTFKALVDARDRIVQLHVQKNIQLSAEMAMLKALSTKKIEELTATNTRLMGEVKMLENQQVTLMD
jgi:hypothetical protein